MGNTGSRTANRSEIYRTFDIDHRHVAIADRMWHPKREIDAATERALILVQARVRGFLARNQMAADAVKMLVVMDPGQDLDDEMSLVLMRSLIDRKLATCVAVVAVLAPSAMRAQLAAGTMRQLGMYSPVGAGSDGGAKGDTASMDGLDYMARGSHYAAGMDVMRTALAEATPKSIVMLVISSLKDTAQILREEEPLCCRKLKQIVIMVGVKPFEPGSMLEPDSAHNNMFDLEAAQFVHRRCQELGIPLLVVSRHAAYSCTVPRQMYDELAATGSHIGKHLQMIQRSSIERLWQRAASPEGSAERAGLPARCDKQWFAATFCAGKGAERDAGASIWDLVVSFNM